MSYDNVTRALSDGASPDMLCMTCPWDRFCVTPPTMTRAEVDAKIKEAQHEDNDRRVAAQASGGDLGFPVTTLLTALSVGGRDTAASVCPVFAMRLRLPEGRHIVDLVKTHMQSPRDAS